MALKRTHMIVCNYEEYPLNRLLAEEEKNGYVFFATKGQVFKVGDDCYFMYKNLPDGTSRVILRGTVCETDYGKSETDEYICDTYPSEFRTKKHSRYPGMLINEYRLVALEDKERFSDKKIKEKYGFDTFVRQTHRYFWKDYDLLHESLEGCVSRKYKDTLKKVNKYFSPYIKCAFEDYKFPIENSMERKKRQHISFTSGHSFMAFSHEHHLIQDKILEKSGCPKKLRNHPNNLIRLCPVCHSQIHNGTKDIVLEMFDYLYCLRKNWYEETYGLYAKKNGYNTVREWMHTYYGNHKYEMY